MGSDKFHFNFDLPEKSQLQTRKKTPTTKNKIVIYVLSGKLKL